jgi:hypothetical protein
MDLQMMSRSAKPAENPLFFIIAKTGVGLRADSQ